jgi:hypothetical protein
MCFNCATLSGGQITDNCQHLWGRVHGDNSLSLATEGQPKVARTTSDIAYGFDRVAF